MSKVLRRTLRWGVGGLVAAALVITAFIGMPQEGRSFSASVRPAAHEEPSANPLTGQYLWFPSEHPRSALGAAQPRDSYARFLWQDLEPSPGQFAFEAIDAELGRAQERRGRFGFRVMAVCTTCRPDAAGWPRGIRGEWRARSGAGWLTLPDWNEPEFIDRWARLMQALGERYDGDPRLAYVDVGGYGNWGEGHNWPYDRVYPGPQGQTQATPGSLTAMISATTRAWPTTWTVLNPPQLVAEGGRIDARASWQVLRDALRETPRLGLRNDCLGGGETQRPAREALEAAQRFAVEEGVALHDQPLQRWRTAPFVTEWCDSIAPQGRGGSFAQGAQQVRRWHVTTVSNGNFQGVLEDYPAAERRAFESATRHAGFRLAIEEVTIDRAAGQNARLRSVWTNEGSAPPYDRWSVTYRVVTADGEPLAQAASVFDLRSLLGDGSSAVDAVSLPDTAELRGQVHVQVRVTDASGYLLPMELERGRAKPDGWSDLGSVEMP